MTQKKSYSRYFIILQEDEKGYALGSDKLPSGYAKLEIKNDKCKVSYYVQNLKKESTPYFMVLVCNKKDVKKIIRIGEMNIDEYGRTEVSYEYPVDNVANCNIGVDKVVGAAIVRFMNTNLISVMSGFTSTDIPEWKGFEITEDENKKHEERVDIKPIELEKPVETLKPVETETEKENIFEEYEKKIEEAKKNEEEPIREILDSEEEINVFPEEQEQIDEDVINNEEEEYPLLNEDEYYNNEDLRNKKKNVQDKYEVKIEIGYEEKKKQNEQKDTYFSGEMGSFFRNLVSDFEELEGYFHEIKRCKWYKVPVNRPEDMHRSSDYNKNTIVYNPMMNYYPYIGKHKHYLMGYKFDKDNNMKYFVYGIPGTKARSDQPFGGKSGFVTWVPLVPYEENENSMGYWLMFYDFNNSTIVIPVR
ncbi:hypothetical protein [Candidatus Clostridium radicumherbarum]|uniref:DUF7922 domain-containing protein n=1 Tax=Candidatus Clostridium radicumherbarum TaxID=3381662 RepID=A0ABW8TLK3_9CLOT